VWLYRPEPRQSIRGPIVGDIPIGVQCRLKRQHHLLARQSSTFRLQLITQQSDGILERSCKRRDADTDVRLISFRNNEAMIRQYVAGSSVARGETCQRPGANKIGYFWYNRMSDCPALTAKNL
jgi:hypothetical protein